MVRVPASRPYAPELDDPYQVWEDPHGGFYAGRTRHSLGTMHPTREKAQAWCDEMNAVMDLHCRKDDALDWALAHEGVHCTSEEIHAALSSPDCVGLLAFEARMADPTMADVREEK